MKQDYHCDNTEMGAEPSKDQTYENHAHPNKLLQPQVPPLLTVPR